MTKMNQLYSMMRIIHPNVYTHLPLTKQSLNNWKHCNSPQSATAINSTMARAFASYLNWSVEPYGVEAIIIQ